MTKLEKAFMIFTFLSIAICNNRLDFNSTECHNYRGKLFFLQVDSTDWIHFQGNSFQVYANVVGQTQDVQISIRYTDAEYFNDPTYWGLVQEDGKSPESTCLDFKLLKFADNNYQNGTQVTDLIITPSNNTQNLWRYYNFTIKEKDFSTRLIQTTSYNQYIYHGFYGIGIYAARTYSQIFSFYFYFTLKVDVSTGALIETFFKSLDDLRWYIAETIQIQLNWCSDFSCQNYTKAPDLHLNDQFVLQQIIKSPGLPAMRGFELLNTEVWYTGNGLNKKATIKQIDNSTAGEVKILLNAEIVWENVIIIVHSELSDVVNQIRLLGYFTFDTNITTTCEIGCIKAENSDSCPTCEQECDANGYARGGCDACTESGSTNLYGLLLFLLF